MWWLLVCAALGGDIYVSAAAPANGDGSSWTTAYRTIGEALAVADDDTVYVGSGTYIESDLLVPSRTTLVGAGAWGVTVQGTGGTGITVRGRASGLLVRGFDVGMVAYRGLDDLAFEDNGVGLDLPSTDGMWWTFTNLDFVDNSVGLRSTDYVSVVDSTFVGNKVGILAGQASYVRGSTFAEGGVGLLANGHYPRGSVRTSTFEGLDVGVAFEPNAGTAVAEYAIYENTLDGVDAGIVSLEPGDLLIHQNRMSGGTTAIELGIGEQWVVNNLITDFEVGMVFDSTSGLVAHNTVFATTGWQCGSSIWSNTTRVHANAFSAHYPVRTDGAGCQHRLTDNVAQWSRNYNPGNGLRFVIDLGLDANYVPVSTSTLRDAATDDVGVVEDLRGVTRNAPDVGALEYRAPIRKPSSFVGIRP
ncbi:MAG: hypothetical protein EP330_23300 [Deltaproteobacteria bacterium]|nr:MAG: hypothetical protein EP330_23300 [Deltaproteobacteria bacterium]